MFTTELYETLLVALRDGADRLLVVSGYASPATASKLLSDAGTRFKRDLRVDLIVGMVGRDGITRQDHDGFLRIEEKPPAGALKTWYCPKNTTELGATEDGQERRVHIGPDEGAEGRSRFLPAGVPHNRPHFQLLTDDGELMFLTAAADNAKDLHSVPHNALLGHWLRKRIGVPSGAEVTLKDLERAGSRFVKVYLTGEDSYYMEYSADAEAEGADYHGL